MQEDLGDSPDITPPPGQLGGESHLHIRATTKNNRRTGCKPIRRFKTICFKTVCSVKYFLPAFAALAHYDQLPSLRLQDSLALQVIVFFYGKAVSEPDFIDTFVR